MRNRSRTTACAITLVALLAAAVVASTAVAASGASGAGKDSLVVLEESIAPALDADGASAADPQS